MTPGGSSGKLANIVEVGQDGKPLANPIFYGRYGLKKWVIGNDPMDSTLIETTSVTLPSGWSTGSSIALQPDNYNYYYLRAANSSTRDQAVYKMKWVPNGVSEFNTDWGDNGSTLWSSPASESAYAEPGCEIIGDFLWTGTDAYHELTLALADLDIIDWRDGTIVNIIDMTDWWSHPEDANQGAQLNGGPNGVNQRNGFLTLNCHCSCIKQMCDPAAMDDEENFVIWTNQNGDYVLDRNFMPESTRPWVCNDYNTGPYTYQLSTDSNLFSNCPAYDVGAVSFGLLGPDGDGIGYFAYAGDTAGWKWFNIFVDNGGAYDGIYCDDNERWSGTIAAAIPGTFFVGHDSIKGVISSTATATEITAYPGAASYVPGQKATVPVYVDMSLSSHLLGEYSLTITWPTSLLRYSSASGGTTSGWSDPITNTSSISSGQLKASCINTGGSSGKVNVLNMTFDVIGAANASGTVGLSFTSLSAAKTFTDLLPLTQASGASFTISAAPQGTVALTAPKGGERWIGGTSQKITWTSASVTNVKIEYTADGGTTWNTVVASTGASAGSYTWTAPSIVSTACKVRLSDTTNATVTGQSASSFSIVTGVWGDINGNSTVNSADGLIVASYGVSISVGKYLDYVLLRGDVNGDGSLNLADGLICARYGIQPDYSGLPARVGQSVASVAKVAAMPVMRSPGKAEPRIAVRPDGNGVRVETVMDASGARIGAASAVVRWNPESFRYAGMTGDNPGAVANEDHAPEGEVRIAVIDVNGAVSLRFPDLKLIPLRDGRAGDITIEAVDAFDADMFGEMEVARGVVRAGGEAGGVRPALVELKQNVPNPFNPHTSIEYSTGKYLHIKLNIFNIQGQKVKTLVDRNETAERHTANWDGTDENGLRVSSGVYIYQLATPETSVRKQMLLVR
jgi:hypothetical protein